MLRILHYLCENRKSVRLRKNYFTKDNRWNGRISERNIQGKPPRKNIFYIETIRKIEASIEHPKIYIYEKEKPLEQ